MNPVLGPAPCQGCHLPLFYTGTGRWLERHWQHPIAGYRPGTPREDKGVLPLEPVFKIHDCTAVLPAAVPLLTLDMMG